MFDRSTKSLIIIFGLLCAVLLVGNRLGFVFAGGDGYVSPRSFAVVEVINGNFAFSYPRGSVIETTAGQWIRLDDEGVEIWMYENTTIEIKTLTKQEVEIRLARGRIIASNDSAALRSIRIEALDTITTILPGDNQSIVHYDFLQKVDTFAVDASLTTSAAGDFYQWFLNSQ